MRGLIILCLSTLAVAVPQGYTYPLNQQHQHSAEGKTQISDDIEQAEELPGNQQKLQFPAELPLKQELAPPLEQLRYFTPHIRPVAVPSATYGPAPKPNQHEPVVVTKQFFLHSAPEEEEEEIEEKVVSLGQSRRNYNVVFIRAPANARTNTALKLIPAINEDKTIVYVLSKKNEAPDVQAYVEEVPTSNVKPEVHFIKYKTPEEAKHAQDQIQADYERFGGSTHVSNEGISPVASVIGSLGAINGHDQAKQQPLENFSIEESVGIAANNGYLPPNF